MDTPKNSKPKWLRRLERESWQAELVISGAAIFGTLQLPEILERFQYYLLLNYEQSALFLWFFATSYWALFVYGLIFVFIFHFVLRALWIGLVGLNSVYPDGFAPNNLTSKDFQEKSRREYGDIDGFIRRLDTTASGIFGTGFAFAGLFFNLGLLASLSILAVSWLQGAGLPRYTAWAIGLLPVMSILVGSILSSLLSLKAVREKAWVKRVHFPITKVLSKLLYPINTRFTITAISLMTTQSAAKAKSTRDYLSGFVGFAVAMFFVGFALVRSDAMKPEFIDRVYHRMGDTPNTYDQKNYLTSGYDGILYEPVVPTDYPSAGGPFWVWVPLPERELSELYAGCTVPEVAQDLPRREERRAERQRLIDCVYSYVELYIDDQATSVITPQREYRTTAGVEQFGVRLDLTDALPDSGKHILRVVTHLPYEEDRKGDWRRTYIPFTVVE